MITSIKTSPRQSSQQLSMVEGDVNSFLHLLRNFQDDAPAPEKQGFAQSIMHYGPKPHSQLSPPVADPSGSGTFWDLTCLPLGELHKHLQSLHHLEDAWRAAFLLSKTA